MPVRGLLTGVNPSNKDWFCTFLPLTPLTFFRIRVVVVASALPTARRQAQADGKPKAGRRSLARPS